MIPFSSLSHRLLFIPCIADDGKHGTMGVVHAHGSASAGVNKHLLFLFGKSSYLGHVLFIGGGGIKDPAIDIRKVLFCPCFNFIYCHANENLLKGIHLAVLVVLWVHTIGVAAVAL
jgi:hypothetical protein